ncbi:Ras-related protein Ral-A [Trichinella nelsoni]|uniref:Ras-related protein Ral-A n=1 Tax=Trichinella nelsoni TaxID=6336 RepID=A0A0V0RHF9_9BILA|nr:Ras-related protein Ral-A [Trichinella nelsoni]
MRNSDLNIPILLVGSKSDLNAESRISVDQEQQRMANWNFNYVETSANSRSSVDKKDSIGTDRNYTDAEYVWLLKNKKAMLKINAGSGNIPESVILLEPRDLPSNVVPTPPENFQNRAENVKA